MARFRARKRKQQQLLQTNRQDGHGQTGSETPEHPDNSEAEGKYSQLLAIIEALGRDVKLSYAGSRSSAERLKSGIVRARTLIRECLVETRLNLRQ